MILLFVIKLAPIFIAALPMLHNLLVSVKEILQREGVLELLLSMYFPIVSEDANEGSSGEVRRSHVINRKCPVCRIVDCSCNWIVRNR